MAKNHVITALLVGFESCAKIKQMKRISNVFDRVVSIENLILAENKARKGKANTYAVKKWDQNRDENIEKLRLSLVEMTYKTGPYYVFSMKCENGKIREIYRLDYPHRVVHHAIMNELEPVWKSVFTRDTYSCIKGRGIHGAARKLRRDLDKDPGGTRFCLKLDIRKFYPSVDHAILKEIVRRKIKDARLLQLLDEIIDSAPGVPIGNYLSQYLANLYLAYFDHWVKEELKVKYLYRYADDIVILNNNKRVLQEQFKAIEMYLQERLSLTVKSNYQVFPVAARGIDFVGYVFYHSHTRLRKSIKKNFARAVYKGKPMTSLCSYLGWAKHCDGRNLIKKLIKTTNNESQLRPLPANL